MNAAQHFSEIANILAQYESEIARLKSENQSLKKQLECAFFYEIPESPEDLLTAEQKEKREETMDILDSGGLDDLEIYSKFDGDSEASARVTKELWETYTQLVDENWGKISSQYDCPSSMRDDDDGRKVLIGQLISIRMGWI